MQGGKRKKNEEISKENVRLSSKDTIRYAFLQYLGRFKTYTTEQLLEDVSVQVQDELCEVCSGNLDIAI